MALVEARNQQKPCDEGGRRQHAATKITANELPTDTAYTAPDHSQEREDWCEGQAENDWVARKG